jgi:hypothetical protein
LVDRLLPRPTSEQYREFGAYLCVAHSWYKHLPLLDGRRFVVFIAPDAGIGRLLAKIHHDGSGAATGYTLVMPPEGPEFTEEHPRPHYGWRTTKEYRARFGHLDYSCWPQSDGSYGRDAGPPLRLPARLVELSSFVLYPYVSGTFAEAVGWSVHEDAVRQLRAGAAHPGREPVLVLADLAASERDAWSVLDKGEQEWVLLRRTEAEKPIPAGASVGLRRYLEIEGRVSAVSAALRAKETEKIRRALAALDDWLVHGE